MSAQCKGGADTQCLPCSAAHCPADGFNANFGLVGGCSGSETDEKHSVQCGTIKESYGEACAAGTFKLQVLCFFCLLPLRDTKPGFAQLFA